MNIRRYWDGDLKKIDARSDNISQRIESVALIATVSTAFTIEKDDMPVASFGAFKLHRAVWFAWMYVSERVRENGLSFARGVKATFRQACKEEGILRLNAQIDGNKQENVRFAKAMGFVEEFTQINAGPGAKGDVVNMVYWP